MLARQWRGPHTSLLLRLIDNELRFDGQWPGVPSNQRYIVLLQLAHSVNYDRLDTDYWAWIFVWWRFSHLGIFDWQLHAHSRSVVVTIVDYILHFRPWDAVAIARLTSEAIVAHWRASTRSRPIIRLLVQHLLCLRQDQDLREDLHEILTS